MAITLNLTERQLEGLAELIVLAKRGREDFEHQAKSGDYSETDKREDAKRWDCAQATIKAVEAQRCCGPLAALEAVEEWVEKAVGMYDCEAWGSFTCSEAEAFAELARSIGRDEVASMIIESHAEGDDDPEDDHYRKPDNGER